MEDKKINETESLNLITSMIRSARTNQRAKINSNIILLWGYVTVAVSIIVWLLKTYDVFTYSSVVWFLCPLITFPVSIYLYSKEPAPVKTYIDHTIDYIAVFFAVICSTVGLSTLIVDFPAMFIEGILVGMLMVIIGILIKFKPVIVFASIGIILSHSILFISSKTLQIPVFALIIIVSMIIPGYLLKKAISKNV